MIELTVKEMELLSEIDTLIKIKHECGIDEYVLFGDDRYYFCLKEFYGMSDDLIERIKALSPSEKNLLEQKIEYYVKHPLEIPYHTEWEPSPEVHPEIHEDPFQFAEW